MSGASDVLLVVVTIMGLGVVAQVLADRLAVPSVLFLILAGVGVGPEGLGVISPDVFGDALPAIVGLSVAIIVFEGAFSLQLNRLREAPRETIRLVTLGAAFALLGTAAVVHYALGVSWDLSLVVGALLVATGPTVITPVLKVVPVRERVASTLETEGVVNDVTAAILAVVIFEYALLRDDGILRVAGEFAYRLGFGVFVGTLVAVVLWYVLRHTELTAESAPQNARLLVLIGALGSYGIAEAVATEAGIAAVATGGIVLGNLDVPYREDIEQFKGDVTLLVLAFVFITLASLLSIADLLALGVGGLVVVVAVVIFIRPLLVLACTVGDQFDTRERLFMSALGPRGIIPASVATLFALELRSRAEALTAAAADAPPAETTQLLAQAETLGTQADVLVGTVFLVILVTVVAQGGFARHIAQHLDVIPMRVLIVGGGRVGRALTTRLENRGEQVVIIESDDEQLERLRQLGYTARRGDGTDRATLRKAGAENAAVLAATTNDDDVNLLVAQLGRNSFDVERVIARVNTPANVDAFEDLAVETVQASMSIAHEMDNRIERPAISEWMTELDRSGDVQEIEVTASNVVGQSVSELTDELPEDVHLALLSSDGNSRIPHADDTLQEGDHITFIGRTAAVNAAIDYCHPD
jgi:NhaP-type Na+/H+ or K+/H+ antiporter/Trk K+ transport system NAD-binding subunit